MEKNNYATNKGGYIKAPKPAPGKDEPNATVTKGQKDLRIGKK